MLPLPRPALADTDGMTTSPAWLLRLLPRDRTVLLSSPLSPDRAAAALSGEMAASQEAAWLPWILDRTAERIIQGAVSPERIRLVAGLPDVRNSFRPVLQARLGPSPDGCQLCGRLGQLRYARVFLVVLVTLLGVAAALMLGHLALGRSHIHGSGALWASVFPLVGLIVVGCVIVGFVSLATRFGRTDGEYLMSWVARVLHVDSAAGGQPCEGDQPRN